MPTLRLGLLAFIAGVLVACAPPRPDPAADRAALLRLHQEQRTAHVERKAELLTGSFADTFYSVSRGRVTTPSRDASTARFQSYFDGASFRVWDDVAAPVIRISPDGQMAYVIVQKRVGLAPKDSTSAPAPDTIYAWVAIYEKHQGQWRLTALASTDRVADPTI
jgi:hypothetical protein